MTSFVDLRRKQKNKKEALSTKGDVKRMSHYDMNDCNEFIDFNVWYILSKKIDLNGFKLINIQIICLEEETGMLLMLTKYLGINLSVNIWRIIWE